MSGEIWGILLAAGKGERLASSLGGMPKQFLKWKGMPLYWHSALTLARGGVEGIVIVVAEAFYADTAKQVEALIKTHKPGIPIKLVVGGPERQDSVRNGLARIPRRCDRILVHDAARPFATASLTRRVISELGSGVPVVIPGVPVADTIKSLRCGSESVVEKSLVRSRLRAVQTPQGFMASSLLRAHEKASELGLSSTDDAMLWEQLGGEVKIIPGENENIKITVPSDLQIMGNDHPCQEPCSGMGYDVHRFGMGRPLKLGGIMIPCDLRVIAHSDGDVLLHSLMDALLGMAALGDIGQHFPDSDQAYEGISSCVLLDEVTAMLNERKIRVTHIDMTVVAQKPRLTPWADQIKKNVARLMCLGNDAVNFKATTEENLGFTGAGEGIKAYSLACGLKMRS